MRAWLLILLAAAGCGDADPGRFDGVDDKGADPSGPPTDTGTDGTTDSPPWPNTTTTGSSEQCVILYGGNDRVRGGDQHLPVEDQARTLQAWVRTTNREEQIAIGHGRPSPGQGFQLGTVDGLPIARTGLGGEVVIGDVDVADDRWHHLLAAYDGAQVVLMVDGILAGNGWIEGWTLEGDVVAGNTPTGDLSKPWVGWLDDVRIYRGARAPEQVPGDLEGPEDVDLLLWWDFEVGDSSGPGVTVEDLSGYGHDGTTGGTDGSPAFSPCR